MGGVKMNENIRQNLIDAGCDEAFIEKFASCICDESNEYAQQLAKYFDSMGVRAKIDDRNEKIGRKIRDNEMKRIPYMLVVGEKEQADGTVAVRKQGGGDQGIMSKEDFAKKINDEVAEMLKGVEC